MTSQMPSLHYATPPRLAPRRWWSVRTTAVAIAGAAALHVAALIAIHYEQVFKDFHLKLPALTMLVLDFSEWWIGRFGWIIGWGAALAVPALVALVRPRVEPGS